DGLWEKLSAGGSESRCGWLKDRYGLSWQIVPAVLPQLLAGADNGRARRVMAALVGVTKLGIRALGGRGGAPVRPAGLPGAWIGKTEDVMKYMLLIYGAEDAWTEDERRACMVESLGICDELAAQGKFLGASPLQPARTAFSVRVRGGSLVTEGPFAETTEQLGG